MKKIILTFSSLLFMAWGIDNQILHVPQNINNNIVENNKTQPIVDINQTLPIELGFKTSTSKSNEPINFSIRLGNPNYKEKKIEATFILMTQSGIELKRVKEVFYVPARKVSIFNNQTLKMNVAQNTQAWIKAIVGNIEYRSNYFVITQ